MTGRYWIEASALTLGTLFTACGSPSPVTDPIDAAVGDSGVDGAVPCQDGATRATVCGNCGTGSEVCEQGIWTAAGECLDEGECSPAAIESESLPQCSARERVCDASCEWADWTVIVPPGECEPGETRLEQVDCPPDRFRHQTCSAACSWETEADACVDACGGTPRSTSFVDEEDVCIPAGPFMRGTTLFPSASPVAEVTLSAYYADRYTVTNRRYKLCFDAGVCPVPLGSTSSAALSNPVYIDHPVSNVTFAGAEAFCSWDGARRILTEAEWEKAARGPSPSEDLYTWDGTEWDCALLVTGCPGYTAPPPGSPGTDPYFAFLQDDSFYGVRAMLSGGMTWVSDFWGDAYYADPSSLIDPHGPPTGSWRVMRGYSRPVASRSTSNIAKRHQQTLTTSGFVRCGRNAIAP